MKTEFSCRFDPSKEEETCLAKLSACWGDPLDAFRLRNVVDYRLGQAEQEWIAVSWQIWVEARLLKTQWRSHLILVTCVLICDAGKLEAGNNITS
jgi:hypothetical protein